MNALRSGLIITLAFLTCTAAQAWQEADLPGGIHYVQSAQLTDDAEKLVGALGSDAPQVVDVRGTPATLVESEALLAALRGESLAGPPALRVVLINKSTSAILQERLGRATPGVVVLSPVAAAIAGTVGVKTPEADDAEAAKALAAGAKPTEWLTVPPTKVRNDEAALAKLHAAKRALDNEDFEDEADEAAPAPSVVPSPPPPSKVDILLQRAVQLHEAWKVRAKQREQEG